MAETYQRAGATVRAFTASEDALITELRLVGMGTTEIAKFVAAACGTKRSPATINMRLKTLAVKEEAALDG
jgi:hypothetical protein